MSKQARSFLESSPWSWIKPRSASSREKPSPYQLAPQAAAVSDLVTSPGLSPRTPCDGGRASQDPSQHRAEPPAPSNLSHRRRPLLKPSQKVTQKFRVLRHVSSGGSSDVWLCQEKATGRHVACKVLGVGPENLKDAIREVVILNRLATSGQPEVVQLIEFQESFCSSRGNPNLPWGKGRSNSQLELVMEFCDKGDLFDLIESHGPIREQRARVLFAQVSRALQACHAQGVVHRDVKPENILLTSSGQQQGKETAGGEAHAKLADFGLSVVVPEGRRVTGRVGTRFWAAPEVRRGEEYGMEADVWSLGAVLLCMLTGELPREHQSCQDKARAQQSCQNKASCSRPLCALRSGKGSRIIEASELWYLGEEVRELLQGMLQPCPEERMSMAEVLQHQWLRGGANGTQKESFAEETPPWSLQGGASSAEDSFLRPCSQRSWHGHKAKASCKLEIDVEAAESLDCTQLECSSRCASDLFADSSEGATPDSASSHGYSSIIREWQ